MGDSTINTSLWCTRSVKEEDDDDDDDDDDDEIIIIIVHTYVHTYIPVGPRLKFSPQAPGVLRHVEPAVRKLVSRYVCRYVYMLCMYVCK